MKNASRRNELLKYYKTGGLSKSESRASLTGLNLDSSSIQMEPLDPSSLNESATFLANYNNRLVDEIRQCDIKMKTLVYENFNKILSVGDTLQQVSSMELGKSLSAIQNKIGNCETKLQSMTVVLNPMRTRIHELNEIYTSLEQIKAIITLPDKLTELFNKKKYAETIRCVKRAKSLFQNNPENQIVIDSFQKCQDIFKRIDAKIMENYISAGNNNFNNLYLGFGVLLGLEVKSASDLAKHFAYRTGTAFDECFEVRKFNLFFRTAELDNESEQREIEQRLAKFKTLNKLYLGELSTFACCYQAFFMERLEPTAANELPSDVKAISFEVFADSLTLEQKEQAKKELLEFLNKKLDLLFNFLKKQLHRDNRGTFSHHYPIKLLLVLKECMPAMVTLNILTNLNDRFLELTLMFLDVILDGIFDQVLGLFHHQFEELLLSSKAHDDTTRHMVKWIKEVLIIDALPKLEEFLNSQVCQGIARADLMKKLEEKIISFWHALGSQMLIQGNEYKVLCKFASDLSTGPIEAIISIYYEKLFIPNIPVSESQKLQLDTEKAVKETNIYFVQISQKLLGCLAFQTTKKLSDKLELYAQKPLEGDKVVAASSIICSVVSDLEAVANELFQVIKQPDQKLRKEPKQKINRRANLTSYDDIFDTKMKFIPESIEVSPKAVMEVLAKSVLKTLVEYLRVNSYDLNDFHQIQVDLNYYSFKLWEYLTDAMKLIRFTIRSAAASCEYKIGSQPTPMDENLVHAIATKT